MNIDLTHTSRNSLHLKDEASLFSPMGFPSTLIINNSIIANNTDEPAIQTSNIARVIINDSTFYNNTS
jgi:hypothetical protein